MSVQNLPFLNITRDGNVVNRGWVCLSLIPISIHTRNIQITDSQFSHSLGIGFPTHPITEVSLKKKKKTLLNKKEVL